ncbi:uridine kinase [Desulfitispora alkaliphila]|uniref:hypothetical protein n=1 Tax=Desulfitispora alkaliphila TaxID=622674 RepID=UPI003D21DA87
MNITNYFDTDKHNGKTYIKFKVKRRNNGVKCDAKLFLGNNLLIIENQKFLLSDAEDLRRIQRDFQKRIITAKKELKLYPYEIKHYLQRISQFKTMGSRIAAI